MGAFRKTYIKKKKVKLKGKNSFGRIDAFTVRIRSLKICDVGIPTILPFNFTHQ
jgi:hypothetical protein